MPLLREFKALTKSASINLFAYPCELTNMDGTLVTGGPNVYLQLFDKATAPVANDIPIKSFLITGAGPFPLVSIFQNMGPVEFALGFSVGISTTHEKYAAATATYDVFGEIVEGYQSTDSISGLTTTGDLTTPTQAQQVWLDGDNNNSNRLFRLRAKNLSAGDRWIMVFAADSGSVRPVNGDAPIVQYKVATGITITEYFGSGLVTKQFFNIAGAGNARVYYGCVVAVSTTATILTLAIGNDMACEVQYKGVNQ